MIARLAAALVIAGYPRFETTPSAQSGRSDIGSAPETEGLTRGPHFYLAEAALRVKRFWPYPRHAAL